MRSGRDGDRTSFGIYSVLQSAECRVQSAECRVQSAECRVQSAELPGYRFRVQGRAYGVQGIGFREQGIGSGFIWPRWPMSRCPTGRGKIPMVGPAPRKPKKTATIKRIDDAH